MEGGGSGGHVPGGSPGGGVQETRWCQARVSSWARREEAGTAGPWRAVGDSRDGAAGTPRAVGRPVGSKEPEEASRRVWDCGIRGGREGIGLGGEIPAWPPSPGGGVCVCWVCGSTRSCPRRDLGGSECGLTGSRWVPQREGGREKERERERDEGQRGLRVPLCVS